jgi:beta-1,4-N-acetylglucosaminyltransferase
VNTLADSFESKPSIKICLISSHGGHLRELLNVAENIRGEKYFVSHRSLQAEDLLKGKKHYFIIYPYKSVMKYLWNGIQSLKHIFHEKPKVLVSTGPGSVIPSLLLGKFLLHAKIIYIESAANVLNPSKTGSFIYKYADLFFVQWPDLQKHYPRAVYCGLL